MKHFFKLGSEISLNLDRDLIIDNCIIHNIVEWDKKNNKILAVNFGMKYFKKVLCIEFEIELKHYTYGKQNNAIRVLLHP